MTDPSGVLFLLPVYSFLSGRLISDLTELEVVEMQYTTLGKSGVQVSRLCLGMMSFGNTKSWMLEVDEARPIIERAVDLGINFFDTANVYSGGRSEEITGELLREYRSDVIIATKVFFPLEGFTAEVGPNQSGLSRYHIRRAIDESLARLKTDYIDLYQIHRLDPKVDGDFLLGSLNQLIESSKVDHIGASSMYAWQFAKLLWLADKYDLEPFVSMQNHYNLVYREEEREMIPLCRDQKIALMPWSPLARGFLAGKYQQGEEPTNVRFQSDKLLKQRYFRNEDFEVVGRVVEVAQRLEVKPAQVALAWLFSKPYITSPIIGVTKVEHLEDAVEALSIKLGPEDVAYLEEKYISHPILGHK